MGNTNGNVQAQCVGFRFLGFRGLGVEGLGFKVWGCAKGVWFSGLSVEGLGFRFRVQELVIPFPRGLRYGCIGTARRGKKVETAMLLMA